MPNVCASGFRASQAHAQDLLKHAGFTAEAERNLSGFRRNSDYETML